MAMDLKQKTYFLITGASRGIGQTMAIQVSTKLAAGSVVVLIARQEDGLTKTKAAIDAGGASVEVHTFSVDLSKATAEQFRELLNTSLSRCQQKADSFQRAFIIHNAGTVGDVSKCAKDLSNTTELSDYFNTNLFSAISLNCEFQRIFANVPKLVVNITSKCGIVPFASMSLYCTGKAARDMYFKVLAVEEKEKETLVLNYAPGAIDTDMTVKVQKDSVNTELTKEFKRMRDEKTMLTTGQTTEKFIKILEEGKFKSGDHVDYWD